MELTFTSRKVATRNRCNVEGYDSVALIPLRSDKKIIGLLQLNDPKKIYFPLKEFSSSKD